jgi:hypothetical protein
LKISNSNNQIKDLKMKLNLNELKSDDKNKVSLKKNICKAANFGKLKFLHYFCKIKKFPWNETICWLTELLMEIDMDI